MSGTARRDGAAVDRSQRRRFAVRCSGRTVSVVRLLGWSGGTRRSSKFCWTDTRGCRSSCTANADCASGNALWKYSTMRRCTRDSGWPARRCSDRPTRANTSAVTLERKPTREGEAAAEGKEGTAALPGARAVEVVEGRRSASAPPPSRTSAWSRGGGGALWTAAALTSPRAKESGAKQQQQESHAQLLSLRSAVERLTSAARILQLALLLTSESAAHPPASRLARSKAEVGD